MQKLGMVALLLATSMWITGCASTRDFTYGAPLTPTPIPKPISGDATEVAIGVGVVGAVVGTVVCAAECPSPANVAVPSVVGAGALVLGIYVLYEVGMARGLR